MSASPACPARSALAAEHLPPAEQPGAIQGPVSKTLVVEASAHHAHTPWVSFFSRNHNHHMIYKSAYRPALFRFFLHGDNY